MNDEQIPGPTQPPRQTGPVDGPGGSDATVAADAETAGAEAGTEAPDLGWPDTQAPGAEDTSTGAASLLRALSGYFDVWRWSPGLTPQAISAALGVELSPGPGRLQGRDLLQTSHYVPGQSFPVRFRWELDGELALAEVIVPSALPSWAEVLRALGDPTVVYEPGRGPHPGSAQRCYLDRGLTVFDGRGLGYQATWLYPPMTADEYPDRTGAFEPVRRTRR